MSTKIITVKRKFHKKKINLALRLWLTGLVVIFEMLAILFGLYYFNSWMQSLSSKNQMKVIWTMVIVFLVIVPPIILGTMAGVLNKVGGVVKRVID